MQSLKTGCIVSSADSFHREIREYEINHICTLQGWI